jgi:hypothetical protein
MAITKTWAGALENSGSALLISEILEQVHKAKTKADKLKILRDNDTQPMRIVIKSSFDPKVEWVLPKGNVPFKANTAPAGTEHTRLSSEAKKLYHYVKSGDSVTPQYKKELMFIQLLEGLHESEARLIINAKDKKLHQIYKGLSKDLIKEAFGWTDEYMRKD